MLRLEPAEYWVTLLALPSVRSAKWGWGCFSTSPACPPRCKHLTQSWWPYMLAAQHTCCVPCMPGRRPGFLSLSSVT